MTVQQDVQRAGLRALMADPKHGLPEYSSDPKTVGRVGKLIGETARDEERHVRASDGRSRSTDKNLQEEQRSAPNVLLWSVLVCTSLCIVTLLGVLAYWRLS